MDAARKNWLMKHCPGSLRKPAVKALRLGRRIRAGKDVLLSPHGTDCSCPCCGMKLKAFVPGSYREEPDRFASSRYEHTRQDVLCPVCRSLPRHRILALWCERHIELLRSAEILYFAPEYSMTLWMNRNGVSCVTADLYAQADLKLDIQATGLPDDSWDVIFCNHVLEHVDDFRAALREMRRILRPGGSFVCSFPMDPNVELLDEDPSVRTAAERVRRFGQNDHQRVFGMGAEEFLTEAGFAVERIEGRDCPAEILPVVGPADYDANLLFRCTK